MCGLVGVFGTINEKAKKAFAVLHHLDVLRGRDGAGIYYRNFKGDGELIKCSSTPEELIFFNHKLFDYKQVLLANNLSLILGHNRWATLGSVNDENAHPFEFDRVVGAHNGTVQKFHLKGFPKYREEAVDSEILFSGINEMEKGKFKTFQEIINSIYGSMALTWFDKETKTLSIFRNKDRELWYTHTKDEEILFWASEPWMLGVACGRFGLDIVKPEMFKENHLNKFRLKSKKNKTTVRLISCEEYKKVYNYSVNPYYRDKKYDNEAAWEKFIEDEDNKDNKKIVRLLDPPPKGHNSSSGNGIYIVFNENVTFREFEHRVRHGCALCSSGLTYADRLNIIWIDKTTPVCEDCQKQSLLDYKSEAEISMMERGKDVH